MKCEWCGTDTEFGNPYFCYCGNLIHSETHLGATDYNNTQSRTAVSTYRMGGERSAWCCDRCIASRCGSGSVQESLWGFGITLPVFVCGPLTLWTLPFTSVSTLVKTVLLLTFDFSLVNRIPFFHGTRSRKTAYGDPNALHALLQDDLEENNPSENGSLRKGGDPSVLRREKESLRKAGFDSSMTLREKPAAVPPDA